MVLRVITANQSTSYTLTPGDDLLLAAGATITSPTEGITAQHDSAMALTLRGMVDSYGPALVLGDDPGNAAALSLYLAPGATVGSDVSDAITVSRDASMLDLRGGVTAPGASALVYAAGVASATLQVHGTLDARDDGVRASGAPGQTGEITLLNRGRITGGQSGISVDDQNLSLRNFGTVSGEVAVSLAPNADGTNTLFVVNEGLLQATQGGIAVQSASGDDTLTGGGTITGAVSLGAGDDTYRALGSGGASAVVTGEDGADLLIGAGLADTLSGGAGADTLRGGDNADLLLGDDGADSILGDAGNDRLEGAGGDDTLRGLADDDLLLGANGNDLLRGGTGNDRLFGNADNDLLLGDDGNDSLVGGAGNDTLTGGDGADTLVGGPGQDRVAGGAGADVFVFAPGDLSGFPYESIRDFTRGEDLIDVTAFGGLSFEGTSRPIPQVEPYLWYSVRNGWVEVTIDADADGLGDARFYVYGIDTLSMDDFIF